MVNVKKFILDNADMHNADFSKKLIHTNHPIYGVRIPKLRKFAKECEPEYIELSNSCSMEEILLYGFSAGNFKNEDEQLEYLENVLPFIDNWCECDCIVQTLKYLKNEKAYTFFTNLLTNDKEFYVRVGIIGLMRYFIKTDKIEDILKNLRKIKAEQYYVKMALAWFYAELCIFNFPLAENEIANMKDDFIRKKSISKARESFRVSKEQKEILAKLR